MHVQNNVIYVNIILGNTYFVNINLEPTMPAPYHHGNLKEELVQIATESIRNGNKNKLTIRYLAGECNVSPAAAYRHFKNKDHILEAVATQGFKELTQFMRDSIEWNKPADIRLDQLGLAYITFAVNNPHLFRLLFSSLLTSCDSSSELTKASKENYDLLVNIVKDGIESKIFTDDPETVMLSSWSLVHGFATLLVDKAFEINPQNYNDTIKKVTQILDHGFLIKQD